MDTIRRQVRRARLRLIIEQFVERVIRCGFVTLVVAAVAIALPKLFVLGSLPEHWTMLWLVGAVVGAVVAAGVWTFVGRRSEQDAAIELDLRYGLRERIASSLFLDPEDLDTRAGRALVEDAIRRVERIDVGDRFRVGLGRRPWLPLIPAAIAFCLLAFVPDRSGETQANASAKIAIQKQVKNSAESLRKKAEKKKKEAIAKGLKDAEGLFKELEQGATDLKKKDAPDRKKAAVKLSDLAKQLEDRRDKLGGEGAMKQQLDVLKKIAKGPADELAKAMKEGDLNKAMGELKKLQEKIAKGQLDENAKKELEKQVEQMKNKLKEAADAHQQAMENLKKQINEQKQQGNTQNASKLQEQLDKLMQNKPQMDQLKDLAEKLGQCGQCMQNGDNAGAQQALQALAQQLEGMQQQLEEMEMLEEMLAQIDEAKNAMACGECQGKGCKACQGRGFGKGKKPGMGMGEGQGRGPRPDEKNDTAFRDSKARQKQDKGRAVITGVADGPNLKGQTREEIKQAMAAGVREEADPVIIERLPRSRQEHATEYFNAIREGE